MTSPIDIVRGHITSGRLPSAVLGIADAAGVQELVAFGARADDRYPLFSITKPIVALAAARLIEQGRLSADTTLVTAVPGFADRTTTLAHLASHTSGLDEPVLDTAVPLRRELISRGQIFSPGSAVQYSTLAYTGIAALIEHAGGRGWEAEVDDLFASLGSPHAVSTDLADALPVADAAAAGHDMAVFAAQRNPGAGLAGRAEDLLRLGSALLRIAAGDPRGLLTPPLSMPCVRRAPSASRAPTRDHRRRIVNGVSAGTSPRPDSAKQPSSVTAGGRARSSGSTPPRGAHGCF